MALVRKRVFAYPLVGLLVALIPAACATSEDDADGDGSAQTADGVFPEGALINVAIDSTVGVAIDDLANLPPAEAQKIQSDLMAKKDEFWKERARMQLRLTNQRQYFRQYYHGKQGDDFASEKQLIANPEFGQLPLPTMVKPDGTDNWSKDITIKGAPQVKTIDGHKVIVVDYSYKSTLVTDKDSPKRSDKKLANVGGSTFEDHQLPVDPDMLRQKTGLACLTESEFPPNSIDNENAWRFFEQGCTKDSLDCHTEEEIQLGQVKEDCVGAMKAHMGGVIKTKITFNRVAYDANTAAKYRVGNVTRDGSGTPLNGADMSVRKDDLAINRLVWKYVNGDSCEVAESDMADDHTGDPNKDKEGLVSSCVVRAAEIQKNGGGWRHVLEFNATGYNVGNQPVHIGNVNYLVENGVSTQTEDHGIFEKSTCHKHYHFKHYGDFLLNGGKSINKKNGFCLESTTRYSNNEYSPMFTEYGRCIHQGVEIGWGDEYEAGLTCQWLDVTDIAASSAKLGFDSNPDGFLCEGTFKHAAPLGADGKPTPDTKIDEKDGWEHTKWTFKDSKGQTKPVDRPACNFSSADWHKNNLENVDVTLPAAGGLVSSACRLDGEPKSQHYTFGAQRDCALKNTGMALNVPAEQKVADAARAFSMCTPGQAVTLSCSTTGATTQVLRVCEAAHDKKAGGSIDCLHTGLNAPMGASDSLASAVIKPGAPVDVTFTCPNKRDTVETGGLYSVYGGAFVASDTAGAITCQPK